MNRYRRPPAQFAKFGSNALRRPYEITVILVYSAFSNAAGSIFRLESDDRFDATTDGHHVY